MDLYIIDVSSLKIQPEPDKDSKIYLKRGTVVEYSGKSMKFKSNEWVQVRTITKPITKGYVPKRFLKKL